MSHWAEIDENNKVIRVLVGDNNSPDEGQTFMQSLGGTWVKTSYNGTIRFNFAGIGFDYDPIDDAFIAPMPACGHDELILNNDKKWQCTNEAHDVEFS
jgi:hypothetical protein